MDYRKRYYELLETKKQLEKELEFFQLKKQERNEIIIDKLADMLPEMLYEVDLTGNVIYSNTRCLTFFGYTKEDLAGGIKIADIFPDSYQVVIENLKELKAPGQFSSNEYSVRRKDGTLVPILTHSFPIFIDDKLIKYRGIITDVSKQKEYENQIKREKVFLEHLYNSIPVAIAIANSSGAISMINREFTNLFGFTSEEAVNKNINDLIVPDDLKEEAANIDSLVSINKKETRQTVRKDKFGNKIHISIIANAIDINNETVAQLCIYRDITVEKKNQLIQEILYNISTAALKEYEIKRIYAIIEQEQ